jgi:hypothetical protein
VPQFKSFNLPPKDGATLQQMNNGIRQSTLFNTAKSYHSIASQLPTDALITPGLAAAAALALVT